MDKLETYRQLIQSFLSAYASVPVYNGEIDCYTIFDTQQDHYQVMNVGWDGYRRVYGCILHLDIKGEKIWIEQNMTEVTIAEELVKQGVAKDDIVLGFQAPDIRPYTDYASY
ncbi:MAG: XisI protein [Microcystaceae cyanobacterium]